MFDVKLPLHCTLVYSRNTWDLKWVFHQLGDRWGGERAIFGGGLGGGFGGGRGGEKGRKWGFYLRTLPW